MSPVRVTLEVLSNALGDVGKLFFPLSGILVLAAYLGCILLLTRRLMSGRVGSTQAIMLCAMLIGYPTIAVLIGLGRS
ncbi:MAG: hypothetical protein QXT77_08880, partial [Candidatus Methanomethylicaceae archaeon]